MRNSLEQLLDAVFHDEGNYARLLPRVRGYTISNDVPDPNDRCFLLMIFKAEDSTGFLVQCFRFNSFSFLSFQVPFSEGSFNSLSRGSFSIAFFVLFNRQDAMDVVTLHHIFFFRGIQAYWVNGSTEARLSHACGYLLSFGYVFVTFSVASAPTKRTAPCPA